MINAEFWVAVAFVIFVGIAMYMGLHRSILDALDQRTARIKAELEEAVRLKEEAQNVLAQYRRRHQEAEREAEAIIGSARSEAERVAAEAKTKMEEFVARRTKMAQTKIAQAEAQALGGGEIVLDALPPLGEDISHPRQRELGHHQVERDEADREPQELGGERLLLEWRKRALVAVGRHFSMRCCCHGARNLDAAARDGRCAQSANRSRSAMSNEKMPSASVTAKPKIRLANWPWAADGLRRAAAR